MNVSAQAESLALAKVDQKRLERLAALAGRSPKSLLRFVLRDGFDAVEEDIKESLAAMRDIERHGTVPHAEVMCSAKDIIEPARCRNVVTSGLGLTLSLADPTEDMPLMIERLN